MHQSSIRRISPIHRCRPHLSKVLGLSETAVDTNLSSGGSRIVWLQVYSKQALKDWWAQQEGEGIPYTDPVTGLKLSSCDFTPDHAMNSRVQAEKARRSPLDGVSYPALQARGGQMTLQVSRQTGYQGCGRLHVAVRPPRAGTGTVQPALTLH